MPGQTSVVHQLPSSRRRCATCVSWRRIRLRILLASCSVRPGAVSPLVRYVRTLRLEYLTDLDLALRAVLARVDPGKRLERGTAGPFHGLLHRVHLENPVARGQLLRLVKRPIDDGAAPSGELDTPSLSAREQPREVDEHSGLLELVVVPAHRGEQFVAGHCARFWIPFDHQHHPHVVHPPRQSRRFNEWRYELNNSQNMAAMNNQSSESLSLEPWEVAATGGLCSVRIPVAFRSFIGPSPR